MLRWILRNFLNFCFIHFQKRIANPKMRYVNSNPAYFLVILKNIKIDLGLFFPNYFFNFSIQWLTLKLISSLLQCLMNVQRSHYTEKQFENFCKRFTKNIKEMAKWYQKVINCQYLLIGL